MTTPYNIADIVYRAIPRATPELWSTFANKANTTTLPTTFDSGQAAVALAGYGTNAQQFISNGTLAASPTGTAQAGSFYVGGLSGNVTRIGARFSFKGGTTPNGAVVLGITVTELNQTEATTDAWPAMPFHLGIWPAGWGLYYFDTSSTSHLIAAGLFTPNLVTDGATQYEAEGWIIGSTATYRLPDGSWASVTNSNIATNAGAYVFYENYQNNPSTDNTVAYTHIWAQSGAQQLPSPPQLSLGDNVRVNLGTSVALTLTNTDQTLLTTPTLAVGTWLVTATLGTEIAGSGGASAFIDAGLEFGTAAGTIIGPSGILVGGATQYDVRSATATCLIVVTTPGTVVLKYRGTGTAVHALASGVANNYGVTTGIVAVRLPGPQW
jgi:hypothetical protein